MSTYNTPQRQNKRKLAHRPPCGAPTRKGTPCRHLAERGRERCKYHGGRVPRGMNHPQYSTGRFSKAWGALQGSVDAAMLDPDLLDPHRGVAGAMAALEHAGQRHQERDVPEFRTRALELFQAAMETLASGDLEGSIEAMRVLGTLLEQGVESDKAFDKLVERADKYRIAVNDAVKLKLQAATALSVTDLAVALDGLVTLVVEEAGPDTAKRVAERFDLERLEGRLARAGMVLGQRARSAALGHRKENHPLGDHLPGTVKRAVDAAAPLSREEEEERDAVFRELDRERAGPDAVWVEGPAGEDVETDPKMESLGD